MNEEDKGRGAQDMGSRMKTLMLMMKMELMRRTEVMRKIQGCNFQVGSLQGSSRISA